jgi:hypothetical protein
MVDWQMALAVVRSTLVALAVNTQLHRKVLKTLT